MKRKRLYIFLAILISIFLFSTAAIYNQCQIKPEEQLVEEKEDTFEEKIKEGETEEELAEEEEEVPAEEEEEEEETADEEKEAPTIKLEIYEGPTPVDSICYYRVKAIVTGKPGPTIEFSKDDSYGAWGPEKAQVNLNDPAETYILTATATNSEGSATDYITLAWGFNGEEIEILGDEAFISGTNEALNLLNTKAGSYYDMVINYIGIIQQVDKGSGIYVWEEPPRYCVGKVTFDAGIIWYAGTIVHDAWHSKLYHDYQMAHPSELVPENIYSGRDAEQQCLDEQYNALFLIGADQVTLDYVKNAINTEYWKEEDRYW